MTADKHLSLSESTKHLKPEDRAALESLQEHLQTGKLQLPQLPSSSSQAMSLTQDPGVDLDDVVSVLNGDPSLAGYLLKTANSTAMGAKTEASTLKEAVARLGLKKLRTVILAASMRAVIKGPESVMVHAREIWRQANATGTIARNLAPVFELDPERALLAGLLHDLGKIPVLYKLAALRGPELDLMTVGTAYYLFHEIAGGKMAASWNLSREVCSVAACHHSFERNETDARLAAFINLCTKLDMLMMSDDEESPVDCLPELKFLGLTEEDIQRIEELARESVAEEVA